MTLYQEIMALEIVAFWELISYVITAVGLPWAVWLYFSDARRERENEEEAVYLALSDEYAKFSKVLLDNADLQLMAGGLPAHTSTPEQIERRRIIFDMLIALFERAFILVYEEDMDTQAKRRWASWEDYIKFWLKNEDFRRTLPDLLEGEDDSFASYIRSLVK